MSGLGSAARCMDCGTRKRLAKDAGDARDCLAAAFRAYCEANPDPDHIPEPWADEAQGILGKQAQDIFDAVQAEGAS